MLIRSNHVISAVKDVAQTQNNQFNLSVIIKRRITRNRRRKRTTTTTTCNTIQYNNLLKAATNVHARN